MCTITDFTTKVKMDVLHASADEAAFLPTGALQLFRTLRAARPNHVLFAADFDSLPDVRIPGVNAPLVAATVRMLQWLTSVSRISTVCTANDHAIVLHRYRV